MIDIPMMDSYLESLAGYIRDEDKLVTYKWLSKELELHVNLAKIILLRYWEKHKSKKLVATFMLIGNLKSGGMRVEVVRDTDLKEARDKYANVISEHVYSLQKTLLSIESLAGVGRGDSRYSAITCEKSVILSDEELTKLRWGKIVQPSAATETKNVQQNVGKKEIKKSVEVTQKSAPTEAEKSVPKEVEKSAPKENHSETKSEEKTKKISPPTKTKLNDNKKGAISKKPLQTTKVGFGNLFGKTINQQKNQVKSCEVKKVEKKIEPESESTKTKSEEDTRGQKNDKDSNVTSKKIEESPVESKKNGESVSSSKNMEKITNGKKKGKKNEKVGRGKKRDRSRDSNETMKKRKRILVASSSSEESAPPSEDEDMFESPPPEAPPSPPKNETSRPPLVKIDGHKRKVSKLIDETFVDEDGFLVTRKKQVWESCSEEEEEEREKVETKKKIEPEVAKENKTNVKKKQTLMMNFFKKA